MGKFTALPANGRRSSSNSMNHTFGRAPPIAQKNGGVVDSDQFVDPRQPMKEHCYPTTRQGIQTINSLRFNFSFYNLDICWFRQFSYISTFNSI